MNVVTVSLVSSVRYRVQTWQHAQITSSYFLQDRRFVFNNRRRIEHDYLESFENYDKDEEVGEEVVNEVGYRFITFNDLN